MKLLVATTKTQGQRKNDFCFATVGELVKLGSECDGESINGSCGCKRSMTGMDSSKGTTTMIVAELPHIDAKKLAKLLFDSDKKAGWNFSMGEEEETGDELARIANCFKVGDVVEKRGISIQKREVMSNVP